MVIRTSEDCQCFSVSLQIPPRRFLSSSLRLFCVGCKTRRYMERGTKRLCRGIRWRSTSSIRFLLQVDAFGRELAECCFSLSPCNVFLFRERFSLLDWSSSRGGNFIDLVLERRSTIQTRTLDAPRCTCCDYGRTLHISA